jgi:hypothetical protein
LPAEPSTAVARDHDLTVSSVHRHRANCLKLGSSNQIKKEAARGSAAVALLPSRETMGGAYLELRARIDQVVEQAQEQRSLNVAISGLNSIRQTLDSTFVRETPESGHVWCDIPGSTSPRDR